jgi:hypothetical protein
MPTIDFEGTVYDLDYLGLAGWTQVLLRASDAKSTLKVTTQDELRQQIRETALVSGATVQVALKKNEGEGPAEIDTAKLLAFNATTPPPQIGTITAVGRTTTERECFAFIDGQPEVRTNNARCLGILLAGVVMKKPVESVEFDPQFWIVRVKINVPST